MRAAPHLFGIAGHAALICVKAVPRCSKETVETAAKAPRGRKQKDACRDPLPRLRRPAGPATDEPAGGVGAALHELSDGAAFPCGHQPGHLSWLAGERDAGRGHLALRAHPVLRPAVLVLRLPHQADAPLRAGGQIPGGAEGRSGDGRSPDRRQGAGARGAFRRRFADHAQAGRHDRVGPGDACRLRLPARRRGERRDRPQRHGRLPFRRARRNRHDARQLRRPGLRPEGPGCDQSRTDLRADTRGGRGRALTRRPLGKSRPALRAAAPDAGQRRCHRRTGAVAGAGPRGAVRLRPRAVVQEAPDDDPRAVASGRGCALCAVAARRRHHR